MPAAIAGVVNDPTYQFEQLMTAFSTAGVFRAGYRPHGTQYSVFQWYRDALNLAIVDLNVRAAQTQPLQPPVPYL